MNYKNSLIIDGRQILIENEKNLLELIRKAGIDLPTFCYHSELSVYGACRLCIVDIENRGIVTSCSIIPENGMVVKTNTLQLRELRKTTLELILSNHDQTCTTCFKSGTCQLQKLARRFGIDSIPYKKTDRKREKDKSCASLVRDPDKCVLCGDCVRYCHEIQKIGAIDFVHRGSDVSVMPAYEKDLNSVECVYCGQCARVCPTGAILPRYDDNKVWEYLNDKEKFVVVQIAPAVRAGIGEFFNLGAGQVTMGKTVSALKRLGFDKVFDTSFSADMTILEETHEFLNRLQNNGRLPLLTSCCPSWVKFVEHFYPQFIDNLSSCKSPQQMFGSVAKKILPDLFGIKKENLVVVSIMPCTAKKFEAERPEHKYDGMADVDVVLTTKELGHMIESAGIIFEDLSSESLDMPLGYKTGAGVIFGASGGVSEAVLRHVCHQNDSSRQEIIHFEDVRGEDNLRETSVEINGRNIKIAIVHGLGKAGELMDKIDKGICNYDFVEVMSCPDGCIGGAGQPDYSSSETRTLRRKAIFEADKMLQLHRSVENPMVNECYQKYFDKVGSEEAHRLLHTKYSSRKRIQGEDFYLNQMKENKIKISVCVGTSCHVKGSQTLLRQLLEYIEKNDLSEIIEVQATFCIENCGKSPNVLINDMVVSECTLQKIIDEIKNLGIMRSA